MQITGNVVVVCPQRSGTSKAGNEFTTMDFVVEIPGKYPSRVCLNIFGADKIQQLNPQVGEAVTVDFDIDAHEWQGRWFNSLKAWNITRGSDPIMQPAQPAYPQAAPMTPPTPQFQPAAPQSTSQELPF